LKSKAFFIRSVLMLFALCQLQRASATLPKFWFTGYYYDAKALFNKKASDFK